MDKGRLPLEGWIVVEHLSIGVILASRHEDQSQAEAECARRNGAARSARYRACLVLEPIAEGMGGHRHPTSSARGGLDQHPSRSTPQPFAQASEGQDDLAPIQVH